MPSRANARNLAAVILANGGGLSVKERPELTPSTLEALKRMVYEATALSSEEDDGSHRCTISRQALSDARAAIASYGRHYSEDELLRELGLLYNYTPDDSRQFTRWQMVTAIAHGRRIR